MLHLILIRHGETDWNAQQRYQGQTDVPLNDAGREQARLAAGRLSAMKVDAFYASDLSRAWDTAAIISGAVETAPRKDARLREMAFGIIEGYTFDEAQAKSPDMISAWIDDRDNPPEGGETATEFTARVVSFLDDMKSRHDGQTVLVVAHGGPLRELVRVVLGLPPEGRWYLDMGNTGITELTLHGDFPKLLRLNDTAHLEHPPV